MRPESLKKYKKGDVAAEKEGVPFGGGQAGIPLRLFAKSKKSRNLGDRNCK